MIAETAVKGRIFANYTLDGTSSNIQQKIYLTDANQRPVLLKLLLPQLTPYGSKLECLSISVTFNLG